MLNLGLTKPNALPEGGAQNELRSIMVHATFANKSGPVALATGIFLLLLTTDNRPLTTANEHSLLRPQFENSP